MTGIIRRLVADKGFGFIKEGNTIKEYFFHRSDFSGFWDDLIEDFERPTGELKVEFDGIDTPKGLRASNVRRMDFPN